jgi:small-conductance mechanosensitive channel
MIESRIIIQIGLSFAALLIILLLLSLSRRMVNRFGRKHQFHERRLFYARKVNSLLFVILFLLLLSIIWGINIEGLPIYFASFFGIVGIAFFASWSLLSNITASLIIFFSASFRLMDRIKIIDGENTIIGKVVDMSMFTITIETDEGNTLSYPNNLLIQKPVEVLRS